MTEQELQEQAKYKYPQFRDNNSTDNVLIEGFIEGAKWMQEQDKWISVETLPMKPNGVSELYVLASEDEDCLTVEKVFYDTKDNTYWIPFCKEQYFPKWYCYLPSPPKTK